MPNWRRSFALPIAVTLFVLCTAQAAPPDGSQAGPGEPSAGRSLIISEPALRLDSTDLAAPALPGGISPGIGVRARPQLQREGAAAVGDVTVTSLRMATAPGGSAPFANKFSASLSEVYAVFDYSLDTPGTELRVALSYQDPALGTLAKFEETEAYTGTGTASITVPSRQAFPDEGAFRPGWYTTTVETPIDDDQSWATLASMTWRAITIPNDEYFDAWQWNLNNHGQREADWHAVAGVDISAPEAWDITTGRSDLVIAFVGSGVDLTHPDLRDRIWTNAGEIPGNGRDDDGNGFVDDVHGWDFAHGDNDPSDDWGSGTFAAGLAMATTNNHLRIAGVAWGGCIMPVKVSYLYEDPADHKQKSGSQIQDIAAGVRYAVDNGARIIHLSAQDITSNFGAVELLAQAIDYAHERGVLVVVGGGNQALAGNPVVYPGAFENVLAVAATDGQDQRVTTSSIGPWIGVAAPAMSVASTYLNGTYALTNFDTAFTYFAAAEVAGVAALVWSVNPDLTPDEVKSIIERSADDLGSPGRDDAYGWGRVNAERAVRITPHRLTLSRPELTFIQEEDALTLACSTITNPNTSAITWHAAASPADWLTITGPVGGTPSSIQVCADGTRVSEPGTYTATITATSTLTSHVGNPLVLPVRLVRTEQVWKTYLPAILRKALIR